MLYCRNHLNLKILISYSLECYFYHKNNIENDIYQDMEKFSLENGYKKNSNIIILNPKR
jgi:hypothetical protein